MLKKNKGFTLIELLVVIAIIGILAGIVLVSLSTVRSRGRDARRQGDLESVRTALELYLDSNGFYPGCVDPCDVSSLSGLTSGGYLSTLPNSPQPRSAYSGYENYRYLSDTASTATTYILYVGVENASAGAVGVNPATDPALSGDTVDCDGSGGGIAGDDVICFRP